MMLKMKSSSPLCKPSIILSTDRWSLLCLRVGGCVSHRCVNHRVGFTSSVLHVGQEYVPNIGCPRLYIIL